MKQILYIIQLLHLCIDIFNSTYIFIFPAKYDIYYVSWILFMVVHWFFLKNECVIGYIEKKIMNPKYVLGSNPYYLPYQHIFYDKMNIMFLSKTFLINASLLYITYRSFNMTTKYIAVSAFCLYMIALYKSTRG